MSERKLKIAALLKELYGMAEVPVPSSRIPFYFNDVRAGHIERTDAEFLAKTFRFCEARPDAFVLPRKAPDRLRAAWLPFRIFIKARTKSLPGGMNCFPLLLRMTLPASRL